MDPPDGALAQPQKRRACDECRSRKLACSKELDGCFRCRREGISCHYSVQKPMGRPRKRFTTQPREPVEMPEMSVEIPTHASMMETSMDLDMAFMGMDDDSLSFLDVLYPEHSDRQRQPSPSQQPQQPQQPSHQPSQQPQQPQQPQPQQHPHQPTQPPHTHSHGCFERGGYNTTEGSIWVMNSESLLALDVADDQQAQDEEQRDPRSSSSSNDVPAHTPDRSSSDESSPSDPSPPPTICGCLASLYLALDSMQRLPADVAGAIKATRLAARTAHDTILCPVCGSPPLETTASATPPIASLQNMLLLGALLPSLCAAYKRILDMVDAEAERAAGRGREIVFTVDGYGGLWGQLALRRHECGSMAPAHDPAAGRALEPLMWRSMVRALLRLDVYGIGPSPRGESPFRSAEQPGLRDVIAMFEARSRDRHERLDALVAAGALVPPPGSGYAPLASGEKPTCLRIVDIAKKSMSELVIA